MAIASPNYSPNYGTMLQAYALQEAFSQMECDAEYIRYSSRPRGFRLDVYVLSILFSRLGDFIRKLCGKPIGENFDFFFKDARFTSTWQAFNEWHSRHIRCTQKTYNYSTVTELEDEVSLFVVGSDQTWSPYMTNRYATFYLNFLCFVRNEKKKSAYAPSFGTFCMTEKFQKAILEALSSFAYLSCRELKGAKWLEQNLNRRVEAVLDPTLLLLPADWNKVSLPVSSMPRRYVLCYQLGEKRSISEFAEKVGAGMRLPVYYILTRPASLEHLHCLSGIGPGEFISLVREASCVCTDSFHGTIFCINYNIPFFSFTKRDVNDPMNDNERIGNLLAEFGLESRFRNDNDKNIDLQCSFEGANEILSYRRNESLAYLKQLADAAKLY